MRGMLLKKTRLLPRIRMVFVGRLSKRSTADCAVSSSVSPTVGYATTTPAIAQMRKTTRSKAPMLHHPTDSLRSVNKLNHQDTKTPRHEGNEKYRAQCAGSEAAITP